MIHSEGRTAIDFCPRKLFSERQMQRCLFGLSIRSFPGPTSYNRWCNPGKRRACQQFLRQKGIRKDYLEAVLVKFQERSREGRKVAGRSNNSSRATPCQHPIYPGRTVQAKEGQSTEPRSGDLIEPVIAWNRVCQRIAICWGQCLFGTYRYDRGLMHLVQNLADDMQASQMRDIDLTESSI